MEYIILGLLNISSMTSYQINQFIKNNFSIICSDSYGSLQTALKKLVKEGSIDFIQEKEGRKQKQYTLTETGKIKLFQWLKNPMTIQKSKNIELSKLFFMDNMDAKTNTKNITQYIMQLEEAERQLTIIKTEFEKSIKNENNTWFQKKTIEYGLEAIKFEKTWYKNLLKEIKLQNNI